MYAEARAAGKSPQVADFYATAYSDQREQGKSHEYADDYANKYANLRAEGKSDLYAAAYADQITGGASEEYAVAYADQITGRKSEKYAEAYASQIAKGESQKYAAAYAGQIAGGASKGYAGAYAEAYDDEGADYADIYIEALAFLDSLPDQASIGESTRHLASRYAYRYLDQRSEGKPHDYALAYASTRSDVSSYAAKTAASYASRREAGKSKAYAYAYSLMRRYDESPDDAQNVAERFETLYNEQLDIGKTPLYAFNYAHDVLTTLDSTASTPWEFSMMVLFGEPLQARVVKTEAPISTPTVAATARTITQPSVSGRPPFVLAWNASDSTVEAGESFTLTVRMYDVQQAGEHGGISVSFPSLTVSGGSKDRHSSSVADVESLDYTSGLSNITFHQPSATIYHRENNRQFPAEYLLVESDDPTWSRSDDRTLVLQITPKLGGEFLIQIRGWICADEYTDCSRQPAGGSITDQQGWVVDQTSISVATTTPVHTPAAGRIAFTSYRDGNREIYVMNADGSGVRRLTDNEADDGDPSWSADGRRIAFVSNRDGNREIYVMNADGLGVRQLTDNEADDYDPSWSADGRRIAFVSNRDWDDDIYVMNTDGSGVRRLTDNEESDYDPSWSADGRRIAFTSYRDGNGEIYVMNADGSGVRRLTDSEASDYDPSWSPDGRRIVFASDREGNLEIYVMNADGSDVRRLTDNEAWDSYPSWSTDGWRIAFSSNQDGDSDIYVMSVDGSDVRRLTDNEADDWGPSWN